MSRGRIRSSWPTSAACRTTSRATLSSRCSTGRTATSPRSPRRLRGSAGPRPAGSCGLGSRSWNGRASASANTRTSLVRTQTRSVKEMSKEEHGMMNPDEVKELLEAFSEKIPALLNSLTDAIYGKDASAKFGAAVADFYKTLKESGMTDEQAFRLTEQYMSSLNIGGMIANAVGKSRHGED